MMRLMLLAAVLLCVTGAGSARAQAGPASPDQAIENLGTAFIEADKADGLSIAVVSDGDVRFYNFGTVSRTTPRRPTESTVYEIGSITKTFTSLLLAHAVVEGRVDLQDEVRKYLPGDYPGLEFEGEPVRLIHLANTTSALPDNIPDLFYLIDQWGPERGPILIAEESRRYTNAQFLTDLGSATLVGRPGTSPRHSNVAATLLGIILENVYAAPYEDLVARYIETPFGMADGSGDTRASQMASVYNDRHMAMPPFDSRSALASGGLRYSAQDMSRYVVAQLAVSDEAVRLSQKPSYGDPTNAAIGFNWMMSRSIDGDQVLRASGGTFGSSSFIEMYPDLGYGVVLLVNRSGAEGRLHDLAGEVFREIRGQSPALAALEEALDAGGYRNVAAIVEGIQHSHPQLNLTEDYVNRWGYRELEAGRVDQAIGLLQYNVETRPQSANAFDSLGEAYAVKGDREQALVNYRRSVELDPDNRHAINVIARLAAADR